MKYIYKWLDGALNECDSELYDTEEEAEQHRSNHSSFGAITSPVEEVSDDYERYVPDYYKE